MKQNLLFEKKTKKSYSNISLSAIKRILYGRDPTNPNVIFYGSSIYKATNKYANDIDCLEMVQETNPIIIVKRLKEMIKLILIENIETKKGREDNQYIIGDIKCGVDNRIDIDIGYIKDFKLYNFKPKLIFKQLDKLYKINILSQLELEELKSSVSFLNESLDLNKYDYHLIKASSPKYKDFITKYYWFKDFLYNKKVLRWSIKNILDGYLKCNNKLFKLEDTIMEGMTKFDLIYVESGKYQEVSNTMFFKINNKLNLSDDKTDLINDLRQTVMEKLYMVPIDILKAFKLCYSICKLTNDNINLKKISSLLLSDLGIVGKLKGEVSRCKDVLKYAKQSKVIPDIEKIREIISGIIPTLSNIYEFEIKDIDIFEELNNVFFEFDKDTKEGIISESLDIAKSQLLHISNLQCVKYAVYHKLYPINKNFVP